eukprot:15175158-Alexandrium_andersonii.AAC.1
MQLVEQPTGSPATASPLRCSATPMAAMANSTTWSALLARPIAAGQPRPLSWLARSWSAIPSCRLSRMPRGVPRASCRPVLSQ